MANVKIEIQDTGLGSIGGSVLYDKAHADYINMYATTMRPEFDVVGTNNESARVESGVRKAVANEVISSLPTRITIQGLMPTDNADFGDFLKLSRTLGLKQIKGGLGTLAAMPGSQVDGTVYCNVKSIKLSEVISDSVNTIGYTMQLEVVE